VGEGMLEGEECHQDKELKEYYLRRTENGKSKMSTINIVRHKILYRMFAVIKRQTPFVENYLQAA
jgi:hypothetical protein